MMQLVCSAEALRSGPLQFYPHPQTFLPHHHHLLEGPEISPPPHPDELLYMLMSAQVQEQNNTWTPKRCLTPSCRRSLRPGLAFMTSDTRKSAPQANVGL